MATLICGFCLSSSLFFSCFTLAASFSASGSIGEKSALEMSVAVTPSSSSLWLLLLLMMEA